MELFMVLIRVASEAVVSVVLTSAGRRGYEMVRGLIARRQKVASSGDRRAVKQAEMALAKHLHEHPEEVDDLVGDLLSPQPTSDEAQPEQTREQILATALEGFVATLCVMTWETPNRILAVRGSLGSAEGVTVIDARTDRDLLLVPKRDANGTVLHLLDQASIPRMWVALPAPGSSPEALAARLNNAIVKSIADGTLGLASPDRLCAASLAALSGDPESVRRFGKVSKIRPRTVMLDVESTLEQATEPPKSLDQLVLDFLHRDIGSETQLSARDHGSVSRAVAVEHARAGLDDAFLRITGDGMRVLARGVRRAYELALADREAALRKERKLEDDILAAAEEGTGSSELR